MATQAVEIPGIGKVSVEDIHREVARRSAIHFDHWTSDFKRQKPRHLQFISDFICPRLEHGDARIIVCAPPGHGKSELISRAIPAWHVWRWPEKRVEEVTYSDTFADSWGRKVRDLIIEHPELGIRLDQGKDAAVGEWRTAEGGGMICAGIMGGIMGRRIHCCIIDDPVKNAQEAYSPVYQERMRDTYQSTISRGLEPGASVIITMQRWPSNDFVTWLMSQKESGRENWEVVLFPAISGPDDQMGRKMGEALWPERWPLARLQAKRLSLEDQAFWDAQWQQSPPEASTEGLAYHAFSAQHSVRACPYDQRLPLLLVCDFNVNPMSWLIAQSEKEYTPGYYDSSMLMQYEEKSRKTIRILGEIVLHNSNTFAATDEFIARVNAVVPLGARVEVAVYGDASGNSRKTTGPTDYMVIQERLERAGRFVVGMRTTRDNPPVRSRVTTVNNAFLNAYGQRRLFIDPGCKELLLDMKSMRWKLDVAGNSTNELDESNRLRSHTSSALGYLCWGELKMRSEGGWQ